MPPPPPLLLLLFAAAGCEGLRFLNISVPGAIQVGEPVWLKCDFDLEGDDLYSVKWYKNHVEFYRYQPRDKPPGQTYRLLGTKVNVERSNSSHVLLAETELSSEGLYGCEVSGEAPHFATAKAEDEMRVYALPSGGPSILGLQPRYQVGDQVNISCSFGPSKPAAKLNWYINGEVAAGQLVEWSVRRGEGGQWSEARLSLAMTATFLRAGHLRLHCTAEVVLVYARAHHDLVIGERISGPGPQNEPHVVPSRRRPRVSGLLGEGRRYDVGDLVDVNCTSAPAHPAPPTLRWFINDREVPRVDLVDLGVDVVGSSVLGLRFRLQQRHLRQGELRLRCESTQSAHVLRRTEEVLFEGRHQTAELQVANVSSGCVTAFIVLLHWTLPMIVFSISQA